MEVLYFIVVKFYGLIILVFAFFNTKARQWIAGRRYWKQNLRQKLKPGEKRILFHCSSLGEFEQGKPVLESLKKNFPEHKIILTFFSPSGYEIRKQEPLADYVFYLPLDGPLNARTFVSLTSPEMAFFVKYDIWHFFIKEFKKNKIPVYFISSIFRPSQLYFQPYGKFFYKILRRVSHFFVQNQSSLELLYKHGIPQVTVTGDTRFDRVYQNSMQSKLLPDIETFKNGKKLIVGGSTWQPDEKLLTDLYKNVSDDFKMILVPHEISERRIQGILKKIGPGAERLSKWDRKNCKTNILVIDNIGMLSSIYRYADVAFIGGGFGSGIHNILEAVVFGIPVFFGPKYNKFREANELIHWKGAFTVKNESELETQFRKIMYDEARLQKIREINHNFIYNNKGSTEQIINYLKINQE